jgi:hypothetical protein
VSCADVFGFLVELHDMKHHVASWNYSFAMLSAKWIVSEYVDIYNNIMAVTLPPSKIKKRIYNSQNLDLNPSYSCEVITFWEMMRILFTHIHVYQNAKFKTRHDALLFARHNNSFVDEKSMTPLFEPEELLLVLPILRGDNFA